MRISATTKLGVIGIGLVVAACTSVAHPASPRLGHIAQGNAAVLIQVVCVNAGLFEAHEFDLGRQGGSGVVVSERHVLTANHVVDCPNITLVRIVTPDGKGHQAVVDRRWTKHDVARLEVAHRDNLGSKPAIVARPVRGATVCSAVANPSRGFNCGTIESNSDEDEDDLELNVRVERGNSGGGLYDDRGRLVGIITAGHFDLYLSPLGTGKATEMRPEFLP